MLLFGLALLACLLGPTLGCGDDSRPPNRPPTIECPVLKKTNYIAQKKETYTTEVTWTLPTATDPEDGIPPVYLNSGKGPGSVFGRGSHTVTYETKDSGGLKDYCQINFYVKVITCPIVRSLRNGRVQCEGRSYYGDTCNFLCDDGCKRIGAEVIECQKDGMWSEKIPVCEAMTCTTLVNPPHSLGYTCTNDQKTGSICWLKCDESEGYGPIRGQFTKCQNDQSWTNPMMGCEDIEDPRILNCPSQTLVKTKDPNSPNTVVKWNKPITVVDNSGDTTIELDSRGAQADGIQGIFPEGMTLVQFAARDKAGNDAMMCSFIVSIQTLTCDPPKMDDKNLETTGCVDFREGHSCSLTCYLALKHLGPERITCKKGNSTSKEAKGYWSWGQYDTPPAETPRCQVHNCSDLPSPKHGLMTCETWFLGMQCAMQCHVDYDVPANKRFTPLYLCQQATGKWNENLVPNCEWRTSTDQTQMSGYYYFAGSCSNSKEVIKANFLQIIDEMNACPKDEYCILENVEVRCGDDTDLGFELKKRRSPRRRYSYIKYEVRVPVNKSLSFAEGVALGDQQVTKFTDAISQLRFYVNSTLITPIRIRKTSAIPLCRPGLKLGYFNKDSCVPCPSGSFHNVTQDECVACPLGQFQSKEGQTTCNLCPAGKTTVTIANNETSACQEMCLPGTFSPGGVVPCAKCPVGTYVSTRNRKACSHCLTGMTTEQEGADSPSQCLPFDILLQGPVSTPLEGKTSVQICDFTFAVWVKNAEEEVDGVRFELRNPEDGVGLRIDISANIKVTLKGADSVVAADVLDTEWHHVAVIWSQKTITLYKDNVVVKTTTLPVTNTCPSSRDSGMEVSIRGYAYVYLRDLNFLPEAKPGILDGITKTCTSYLPGSLFALELMDMHSNHRILEVIPSTCLRPDPCDHSPCGDNVCIPGKDNVTCACKRGYAGPKCETPPDYCKDNICKNNASCLVGDEFTCSCLPGFAGKLCERRIADGGWSTWYDWSECSTSCGQGVQTRMRFCTNPTPDPDGKPCTGGDRETQQCNTADCPMCDESTLILGKGVTSSCVKSGDITCTIECQLGKVLPERPFPFICSSGFWTPTSQTVSCTDPVTPIAAGINYTVVFGNDITSQSQLETSLNRVGHDFTCAKDTTCDLAVGSSACSQRVSVCHKHGGTYYGSLIVKKGVSQAPINVTGIQQSGNSFIKPLFDTWTVFAHRSDELVSPDHRPLAMEIVGDQLTVVPYGHPDKATIVPGQFGNILKTWKVLDDINWEVRTDNYTSFKTATSTGARKPLYLTARQMMTCPTGSIQGGVFCIKCPPGKYYVDGECKWCTNGLYQDQPGELACKTCTAFKTTEHIGSSDVAQCTDTDVSELHILLGMTSPNIGVLDMANLNYREMSMSPTFTGNVDYVAFNPRDQTIFFSTQSPNTIGRVEYSGQNHLQLKTFADGTVVTGLDVDIGSNLLFYMTNKGVLTVYHIVCGAQWTLLSDRPSSSGLVLDQEFGIYWMETDTIKYMHYGDKKPRSLYTDTHFIWGLTIDYHEKKLMWQSNTRLRASKLDGSNVQTLSVHFTDRFGATADYFFTVKQEGNKQILMRENRDRTAFVSIHDVPSTTSRIKMINITNPQPVDQPCLPSHSDCKQACLPLNTTARQCFCKKDYTLQGDLTTCRRDFSVEVVADKSNQWYKPTPQQYSIPPSKTLRFNLKACHSANLALVKAGRELYLLRIGHRVNNKTMIDLYKQKRTTAKVRLQEKEATLLDCNHYKTFWITWQIDDARRTQVLKVGYGSTVGSNKLLDVADAYPYTVNYVQFGVGINATAHWQF